MHKHNSPETDVQLTLRLVKDVLYGWIVIEPELNAKVNYASNKTPKGTTLMLTWSSNQKTAQIVEKKDLHTSVYKYQCRRTTACKLLIMTQSLGLTARAPWKKALCSGHPGGMRVLTFTLGKDCVPPPLELDLASLSSLYAW